MEHIPVLAEDILDLIKEMEVSPRTFLDGTFGRGGHLRMIINNYPQLKAVAMDRDADAISYGQDQFTSEVSAGQLLFVHGEFANFLSFEKNWSEFLGEDKFDLMLLDLGVSSPQLDVKERGFSFYHDGPLDMRMDQSQDLSAQEIVNTWSDQELSDLFYNLGEIKFPNKVVRDIVQRRKEREIDSTNDLADLIVGACGWRKKGRHPATQYFMALRLAVNGELKQVEEAIPKMIDRLNDNGRLLVITFHSLEDRIVKNLFRSSSKGRPARKKVIQAQRPEIKKNPRARSAKLRVFQREFL